MVVLYIETNFRMSVAKGQDPQADSLLQNTPSSFGKQEVQEALRDAGVDKYFSRTQNFLGWLQSQST